MSTDPPAWRNAPDPVGFRSYGGCDAVLRIEGEQLRLEVRSAKKFVVAFGVLFIPAFALTAWFAIPDWNTKVFFAVGGAAVGLFTFGLVYWLMDYHERLGDYLVIDRQTHIVLLPRCKARFPLDQVFGLQMIRGRSQASADVETDLNLLVAEGQELVRYHVLGSPTRGLVEQVAEFAGFRVEEVDLGWNGYRDQDRDSR